MKCPKCSAENPEGAEFCSLCYARFEVSLRSSDLDEVASRMREKHRGSRLRCPSCGSLSPLDSQFCLDCGFVFEDLEALMVSEQEIQKLQDEARALKNREVQDLDSEALAVTPESEGAAVMRYLSDRLGRGTKPRIHARGRDAITYAMKIIALLGEDMRSQGADVRFRADLISEGSITYLEEVELEIILEKVQEEH